ncbi:STAS domain-containing protein [Streptomyces sulfonofaciens]|uniref:STAS domain-containing protein n=1 Tax=Streptomyces sulfonofaciens TaxID=68272 RepID=UPI001E5AB927|nr:STAS domain-containing protein [Streptomyces sulfonofaciens]
MRAAHPVGLPGVDALTSAPLVLPARAGPDDLVRLCALVRTRLDAGGGSVVCDARALGGIGLDAVELLARLELAARRAGGRIRIRDAAPDLRALLSLAGLRFETEREAEGGEEPGGGQERGEPGDPPP